MKFFTLDLRFQTEGLMKTEFLFTSKKPVNLFTKSRIPGALKPREFVNCVSVLCPAVHRSDLNISSAEVKEIQAGDVVILSSHLAVQHSKEQFAGAGDPALIQVPAEGLEIRAADSHLDMMIHLLSLHGDIADQG